MKRAVDIGAVDAAAIKTAGGKIRLRLLFTTEQLEALLLAANEPEGEDEDEVSRTVTQRHAMSRTRGDTDEKEDGGGDARASVFVIVGTRAWDAWMAHRKRERGRDMSGLTTTHTVEGQTRTGWWFPTLFPPAIADESGI